MGLEHFLPPKIHSNFSSSDKITNFFAIPIISIDAPLKIFVLLCAIPNHVHYGLKLLVIDGSTLVPSF